MLGLVHDETQPDAARDPCLRRPLPRQNYHQLVAMTTPDVVDGITFAKLHGEPLIQAAKRSLYSSRRT